MILHINHADLAPPPSHRDPGGPYCPHQEAASVCQLRCIQGLMSSNHYIDHPFSLYLKDEILIYGNMAAA